LICLLENSCKLASNQPAPPPPPKEKHANEERKPAYQKQTKTNKQLAEKPFETNKQTKNSRLTKEAIRSKGGIL